MSLFLSLGLGSLFLSIDDLSSSTRAMYLDNGVVKIGVDPKYGGMISYFSSSSTEPNKNLINHHDLTRGVQISLSAGPSDYCISKSGKKMYWNPLAGGCEKIPSTIIEMEKTGENTLTLITLPKLNGCKNEVCECYIKTTITLEKGKNYAIISSSLVNHRSASEESVTLTQKVPSAYLIGELNQFETYTGDWPYNDYALETITLSQGHWQSVPSKEHWIASVNSQSGKGVGLINLQYDQVLLGFNGKGKGTEKDYQAAFMDFQESMLIADNYTYNFQYYLVYGTAHDIRKVAYELKGYVLN